MLEIRPNCECCDVDLPPSSTNARICSYECTYCADCAEGAFSNTCPNCGGGLVPRPIRPTKEWRTGIGINHQPASKKRVYLKFSKDEGVAFVAPIKGTPPHLR